MNPSSDRAETLFNSAAQLEPGIRASFLDHACASDHALRARVEELLAAAADAGGFLPDRPQHPVRLATQRTRPMEPGECLGECVGRYKLLEKLGEGGCGVVYLAQQEEPVRRRVALKVIKLGMDTRQVVARFEAERQALALMDHPNIAKVLDGGTTEHGRPYFVMELVRGVRITDYCDEAQLDTAQRLELFAQVCLAVQHAHQKGIIHRDLKPSNILVTINDGEAVPKVIDFGIAKATSGQELTDKSVYTAFEQFIGTPAYMSPEQALMTSLDIDTRSDVYSLGVLLYELLTGRPPFDPKTLMSAGLDAMRRTIREEEPPRPSAVAVRELSTLGQGTPTHAGSSASLPADSMSGDKNRTRRQVRLQETIPLLQGDLDWIVMKCLEKDRRRRYDTAAGLAADIRRHLENEPVIARPPSWGYRVRKTVRRNRSAFATAGVVLVALLLGLGVSAWQAVQKTQALARMTEAERAQSHSREIAEKALTQEAEARRRVDELLEREKDERRASAARVYATDMHFAQVAMDKDNFDRVRQLLAGHYPRPGQTNRPGWEWRYLWQQLQDDPSFEVCRITNSFMPAYGFGTPEDNRWLLQGNRTADRAWIKVLDITDLHAPRHAGDIPMPSSNAISAIALGNRNGLVAYAQAGEPYLSIGPRSMATIGIYDTTRRRVLGTTTNLTGYCGNLAWSSDNRFLLSFSTVDDPSPGWRSRIDVWQAPQLTHVTTLTDFPRRPDGREGFVRFAVNADASAIAIASSARLLSVRNVATGATNWSLASEHRGFGELGLAPDGRTLFVVEDADPGRIRVLDFLTGKELSPPLVNEDGGTLWALVVASDGRTVACRSSKGNLCHWEVGDLARVPKALRPLRATSKGFPFALLPDARTILTLSGDGTVHGWDLTRDRPPRQPVKVEINTEVANYRLRADGKAILIAARDGAVTQRHGDAFELETPLFHLGRNLGLPVFSEDGRWFAAGSANGFFEVWNVSERRQVQRLGSFTGSVQAVQFSPDGTRLIVLDSANYHYAEWDLAASREIRTFPTHRKAVIERQDVLSRDGLQMLRPDGKSGVLWMDTRSGETRDGNLNLLDTTKVAFVPGGDRFAAGGADGYARFYDRRTFNPIATLGDGSGPVYSIEFLEGGDRLILGGGREEPSLSIWDFATQLELLRLKAEGVAVFEIATDGNVLIAQTSPNSKKKLYLWRAPSWEEIERAEAARPNITAAGR